MNTFARMRDWTREFLDDIEMTYVEVHPGPELPDTPRSYIVWTKYPGAGVEVDGAIDMVSWQARCVGPANNHDEAENIANAVDLNMLSHFSSRVGGLWVSEIRRSGGSPSPVLVDDADRTHFVCSYMVGVELSIPNK